MKFCTITPDRGDRPQLLDFCRQQLKRMTVKPDKSYFILDEPKNSRPDLTWRIKLGLHMAKKDGFDIAYIIESDDYYPPDYFEKMKMIDNDFIGCSKTIYYNLRNQTWNEFSHPKRSSLFNTGFRLSALDGFMWPANDHLFLDILIWQHALRESNWILFDEPVGVGIKHNIGKVGGIGHKLTMPNQDDWKYLEGKVDSEALEFYKTLKL